MCLDGDSCGVCGLRRLQRAVEQLGGGVRFRSGACDAGGRRTGRVRPLRAGGELAAAAARWSGRRETRRMDVGIRWRDFRGDARPDLDRAARRAALAAGRKAMDTIRPAPADARQCNGKPRRAERDMRGNRKARLGAALASFRVRRGSRRQAGAGLAAPGKDVRAGQVRPRAAQDQDESV